MKSAQKWVLLGADTLVGREIRELIEDRKLPVRLKCCGSISDQRVLSLAAEDSFDVFEELSAPTLADAAAILLAGSAEQAQKALDLTRSADPQPTLIDLTGSFDNEAGVPVRAPAFDRADASAGHTRRQIVAHPAAIALATVFDAVHRAAPVLRSVATVFEPASARDKAGIDELHQQTSQIFSFQALPKKVYDVQVSFNMLPRLGSAAPRPLAVCEDRILRHLASLLNPRGVPVPSLRLVHAPVFSGYCASVWIEFERRPPVEELRNCLVSAGVEFWSDDDGPLTNSSLAGQSGTLVSSIRDDPGDPRGAWLWVACDNIRESALNAVALAGLSTIGA